MALVEFFIFGDGVRHLGFCLKKGSRHCLVAITFQPKHLCPQWAQSGRCGYLQYSRAKAVEAGSLQTASCTTFCVYH